MTNILSRFKYLTPEILREAASYLGYTEEETKVTIDSEGKIKSQQERFICFALDNISDHNFSEELRKEFIEFIKAEGWNWHKSTVLDFYTYSSEYMFYSIPAAQSIRFMLCHFLANMIEDGAL
jgi:hypothetical protein